jgi:hypothetical protein
MKAFYLDVDVDGDVNDPHHVNDHVHVIAKACAC